MGDRVRPRAAPADLAAVAGGRAVGRGLLAPVPVAERLQHRERRLVPCPEARLGLGHAGSRVLLQQPVCVLAPARALPDQPDLVLALPHHHGLDHGRDRRHRARRRLAQRRALVAEDARVAVLVGADRALDAEVGEHAPEDPHRMLCPGVLGVRLDALERRLGAHPLDLELGYEHGHLPRRALREDDRTLRREEAEAREVLDVAGVEEDVARQAFTPHVLEQSLAPRLQLGSGYAGHRARALLHISSSSRLQPRSLTGEAPPVRRGIEELSRSSAARSSSGCGCR